MECTWDAWRDRMPGADSSVVHVAGRCGVDNSSVELSLDLDSDGIVDDPELVALRLSVRRPPAGDTQFVEKEVGWAEPADPRVRRVRIQGEADAQIDVRDVH